MSSQTVRKSAYTAAVILIFVLGSCSPKKEHLPENLYNLTLKQKMAGQKAKEFINRLHFQEVASTENEIGFYAGERGSAVIYITHYESSDKAKSEWSKMTQKISPENSVFIGGEYFRLKGKQVYRCFGMGQTHFVFSHKTSLFWLSVETLIGRASLAEYLDYLD